MMMAGAARGSRVPVRISEAGNVPHLRADEAGRRGSHRNLRCESGAVDGQFAGARPRLAAQASAQTRTDPLQGRRPAHAEAVYTAAVSRAARSEDHAGNRRRRRGRVGRTRGRRSHDAVSAWRRIFRLFRGDAPAGHRGVRATGPPRLCAQLSARAREPLPRRAGRCNGRLPRTHRSGNFAAGDGGRG